ncbi:MAG TPA: pseudouridine synthase [Desulfurivibrionaceae bacterium]|nr:pseudouridine synthase [Desulfurivibrionaceae bacterium]
MRKPVAERIQKVLANAGLGSRRRIEDWLRQGAIKVNGKVADLGDRITPDDRVSVNGKPVKLDQPAADEFTVLAYHKPVGEICTRYDAEGRTTVFQQLPRCPRGRWINVGRLDISTSGLILFTNNGELANRLMHPTSDIEREYAVRVLGRVSDEAIDRLLKGVTLEDGEAAFSRIEDKGGEGANHWYNVVLTEGRNREVRRLWESQGVTVSRLMRTRFGPCQLPRSVRPGTAWTLDAQQTRALLEAAGLEVPEAPDPHRGKTRLNPWQGKKPRSTRKPAQARKRPGKPAARDPDPVTPARPRGKGRPGTVPATAPTTPARRPARGKAPTSGNKPPPGAAPQRGRPATPKPAGKPARNKPDSGTRQQGRRLRKGAR